ncbi:MAG: CYTH domain-containing protein, partial [Actinomycetota bacterium]|nr:CYTH domain-containing protein [Actinomycetota bacterium]
MVSVHREVEDKFEADDNAELPRLDRLPGVATVHPPVEVELHATYFDTAELALAAAGITVRRRTGGDDAGWHLKLPDGNGHRDELRVPLGRAARTVPKPLRTVVRALSRDRPLAAVATVRTRRCVHRLLDVDGRVLAEVCDDTVSASTPASGDAGDEVRWREWEVELVDGNPTLLVAAGRLLQDVG